jgi:hypothetical protein
VGLWIGTVENGTKHVEADVRAGQGPCIERDATMREKECGPLRLGEELPENTVTWVLESVAEPPGVLVDARRLPAPDGPMHINADVVVVLNDPTAKSVVDVHAGAKPAGDMLRLGEEGPNLLEGVRDVPLEGHFVASGGPTSDASFTHGGV